eukprot:6184505-Pleurochrysis_carterae.AAC.1
MCVSATVVLVLRWGGANGRGSPELLCLSLRLWRAVKTILAAALFIAVDVAAYPTAAKSADLSYHPSSQLSQALSQSAPHPL